MFALGKIYIRNLSTYLNVKHFKNNVTTAIDSKTKNN